MQDRIDEIQREIMDWPLEDINELASCLEVIIESKENEANT